MYHCKYILLCACALVLSVVSWAQAPVYTCDFEDAAERALWTLNAARDAATQAQFENKWYIGAPGHFAPTGSHGLFISADDGATSNYVCTKTMFVAAARTMPNMAAGDYTLYFDWMCNGKKASGEGLYVAWVPDSIKINGAPNAGGLPSWLTQNNYLLPYAEGDPIFGGQGTWQIGQVSIKHDGTPHKLVFLWFSTKGNAVNPGACVDNIELRPVNQCAAPTNVSHSITGDTVVLSWRGNAAYYNVKCYDFSNDKWVVQDHVTAKTCILPGVSEGVQTFIIRAFCDDNTASDYVQYTKLIYHKGTRCIDYMELTNNNCYTGTYENPFSNKRMVDNGYADPMSFHTLHYMPNEYDENTGSVLRTCPEGYLASVRLGPQTQGQGSHRGQGIEFKYKVPQTTSILKIKYATVLENGHDPEENPQFWLDVLVNGKKIANSCGYAFFQANDGAQNGWKEGAKGWVYKDWTEHAINLRDYVGQTLTIRIATTDCNQTVHVGYVYFVLDCEGGEISGLNCGDYNPTTHFTAPAGFNYVWYLPENPQDTLGREREFDIAPLDTNIYNVNIINKNNANCWYTLTVSGLPRIPTPRITYDAQTIRCQNVVTFNNTSCVYRRNQVTQRIEPTTEPVTGLEWDFGDGTAVVANDLRSTVQHIYPDTGGTFTLRVTASVGDGTCPVEKTYTITLPDLSSPTTEVVKHICRADAPFGFQYGEKNQTYYSNLDSTFIYLSKVTGCDSLCHLQLFFHEKGPFTQKDTICSGETLQFHGQILTQSGTYTANLTNDYGCDSIAQIDLFVDPSLNVRVPDTVNICPEESMITIPFAYDTVGRLDSLSLLFSPQGCAAGFLPEYTFSSDIHNMILNTPAAIRPDVYAASLAYNTPLCEAPERPIYVQVCYSASIIQQRPRLLMLLNEDYNGGYRFSHYQWYRDGEPVEGGTGPNLAMSIDDMGHEYFVVLTREGETTPIRTCSVWYGKTPVEEVPVAELDGPLQVFNAVGIYLGEVQHISELNYLSSGIYIVTNGNKTAKMVR